MTGQEYNYWLCSLKKIGILKKELLLEVFGSAEAVYNAKREDYRLFLSKRCPSAVRLEAEEVNVLCDKKPDMIRQEYANLIKNGIYFVSKGDEEYPDKLKNISQAPLALYVRGRLPQREEKLVAMIGARECSPYGREMARYFAGALAENGISVVSGLAYGIDAYSQEATLSCGGITYGVLGSGIDICYPRANLNLYMEVIKNGGIISEYAPGVKPYRGNFPMRNRIISGLCDAILVVEAKEKSGSLITVDWGLEQGKDIYTIPGRVTDRLSEGCNNLLKMGAKPVTSPSDILEDYFPGYQKNKNHEKERIVLEGDDKLIYECLNLEPIQLEEILQRTGLAPEVLMERLLRLELQGWIRQPMKNYFVEDNRKHSSGIL